jgi:predicted molibdopterin-dependent oxidoreductase YjgC
MVSILVDQKKIEVQEGTSVLKACLENGITIPNLCYLKEVDPAPASCRLCFVEIDGVDRPVAACSVPVQATMVVRTDTPAVRRLQRTALKLLLSVHDVDCKNCPANRKCALQHLARFLNVGLKPKGLQHHLKEPVIDWSPLPRLLSQSLRPVWPVCRGLPEGERPAGAELYQTRLRHGRQFLRSNRFSPA